VKQYSQLRTATYCKTIPKIPQKSTATTDNSKDIYTSVVVNIKDFDIDEMFDAVKSYQIRLNGESDELNIRLYRNKGDLFLSNPVAEKTFYKDSDE